MKLSEHGDSPQDVVPPFPVQGFSARLLSFLYYSNINSRVLSMEV
ncbi:MAG: hypothetical protein PWP70_1256 [Moorella sp. (in: firmicutes)]|nr:hypothetical protein [Moorella sp. (in: firmicutes)]